ncbi:hybrid sensor histidine kinase/response regulator [Ramlibacter alkalitolerans]|uniref:histidine kinase n=1 Tax=Ramlibacter alkalitolerans TaxID=2039631 RepID=A0ABS1JLI0_9BURK|nr:response regulator [Ramlibacter alkalitolerans]MBL0425049.1 response regulator [Ramlibacter alkalitolerans]
MRALLVEDSRLDAELVRVQLERHWPGVQLDVLRDEAAFIAALRAGGWDVVLSDFELPGFTGADLLAHRNVVAPKLPFIFVSGVIGEDNAAELLKKGATDYVSKSRLARLAPVLERALREADERRARVRAERQLRQADRTLARVLDALRDYAVILLDDEGCIQFWNRGARMIFGYDAAEILGTSAQRLFAPEDGPAEALAAEMRAAREHGRASDNRWLATRSGERLWAEGVLTALEDDEGRPNGFCKLVHDGTRRHLAGEALRAAKEEADRANQAKDRFLAVLSHELRTPLAPITTAVHVLEKSARIDERHRDLLPMIRRNVALEARLIDDLLDLTAINAGKVSLHKERVDMHQLVQAVVGMVADTLGEKRIELELSLQARDPFVEADQARMQQVLWNIVRNALKFTPVGGRVLLHSESREGEFHLACADSGIGIASDALARIFSPFEQADADVARSFGGLGLGLAIAQGLMVQHGGRIRASSDGRGRGATFAITLPSAASGSEQPAAAATLETAQSERKRVLLVEDNQDAATVLALCLEEYGYVVEHVSTCAEALRAASDGSFDAVLTDLGLPDGSGIDVGRALSGRLPVVALSGYGRDHDRERSSQAGFAAHLVKPADPAQVHACLSGLLSGQASPA